MTKVVCAKCKADWTRAGNPARCPACEQVSFGIVVPATRTNETREVAEKDYQETMEARECRSGSTGGGKKDE